MITNLNLSLLNGGRYRCTPHWNQLIQHPEDCYKLYFPINGNARLVVAGEVKELEVGYIYFISGNYLEEQVCDESMDLYWIHFLPDSLKIRYQLNKSLPFHRWTTEELAWALPLFRQLNKLFEHATVPEEMILKSAPANLMCRIHGVLTYLLGDVLAAGAPISESGEIVKFRQLERSIDFMDKNYLSSPSLEEVAMQSHLAPNYFHRLFKSIFKITPYNYMVTRRIDLSRQLLVSTALSVKEIAFQAGYENEFHFSRTFKKQIGVSPTAYRKNQIQA